MQNPFANCTDKCDRNAIIIKLHHDGVSDIAISKHLAEAGLTLSRQSVHAVWRDRGLEPIPLISLRAREDAISMMKQGCTVAEIKAKTGLRKELIAEIRKEEGIVVDRTPRNKLVGTQIGNWHLLKKVRGGWLCKDVRNDVTRVVQTGNLFSGLSKGSIEGYQNRGGGDRTIHDPVHGCPKCSSPNIRKDGVRDGHQMFKCKACKHQFVGGTASHLDNIS
jgi:hypothetical protein